MPESPLPRQIDRYRVLAELGRGSMGRVYLASDPHIERRIALKVLMPERLRGAGGEERRRRFLREARAAGGLSHRGIVTIYDAGTDPDSGCPYLAMEWVEGCSLKALLRREGPFAPERAASMAAQVARALDYAHRRDIVHRDVKPANLLVAKGDRPPAGRPAESIKVVDFGIAKLVSRSLTRPGRVLGSPHYMAPEQARGLEVDGRADLFALGAVLYECLTGRAAFRGETVTTILHQILAADPPPIERPGVRPALRAVVRRALEKLPRDRYRSGAEMAAALETAVREPALGAGRSRVPAPGRSGTTTEVMARPADLSPPPVAAGSWRWTRLLVLATLVLTAGVLLGRSLDPQILEVPVAPVQLPEAEESPAEAASRPPAGAAPDRRPPPVRGGLQPADHEARAIAPGPPPAAVTHLELVYLHRLRRAELSVWIDGRQALSARLETRNPLKRLRGQEHRWLLPVPAGEHLLEIRVRDPSKRLEARNQARQLFSRQEPQRLTVELWPDSRQLGLQWESL